VRWTARPQWMQNFQLAPTSWPQPRHFSMNTDCIGVAFCL
jgi:hypothetical protein